MKMIDRIGEKYNKLTIIEIISSRRVKCKCDCGNEKEFDFRDIKRERVKGCGCQQNSLQLRELARKRVLEYRKKGIFKTTGGDFYPKENREFKYILRKIKSNKKRKECFITIDDLKEIWKKQNGVCPYTKIELKLPTTSKPNPDISYNVASVDRIDSSKPYEKNNIQFISRNANYAKNILTHEQMLKFINIIIENNK
jgi:hypothetical protein